jgi:hypothetical protein
MIVACIVVKVVAVGGRVLSGIRNGISGLSGLNSNDTNDFHNDLT